MIKLVNLNKQQVHLNPSTFISNNIITNNCLYGKCAQVQLPATVCEQSITVTGDRCTISDIRTYTTVGGHYTVLNGITVR